MEPGAKAIYGEQDMLMSAAALNRVVDGPGVVTVPDDVHDLIEAVYGPDAPVPPSWREAVDELERNTRRATVRSMRPLRDSF